MASELTADLPSLEELLEPKLSVPSKYDQLVRELIPLQPSDLDMLRICGPERSVTHLEHLRAYHHMVALKLASGERPISVAASLGISTQTIYRLQNNPQFSKLVEGYREKIVEKTVDHFELMDMCAAEALMAIHERLAGKNREEIPLEALRRSAETLLDRIGHSPIRRSETLNRHQHELGSETIKRIRELHSEDTAYEAPALEAAFEEVHQEESKNSGAAECIAGAFEPVAEAAATREESRGADVSAEDGALSSEGA